MLGVGIVHWSHHINHLVYKLHCKPATSSHSVSLTSAGRFEDTQRCSKSKDSQFLKVRGELKSRTMDYTVLGRLSCMQYISCFLFWSNTLTRSLTPSLISHWNYPCFHIWENVQIALLQTWCLHLFNIVHVLILLLSWHQISQAMCIALACWSSEDLTALNGLLSGDPTLVQEFPWYCVVEYHRIYPHIFQISYLTNWTALAFFGRSYGFGQMVPLTSRQDLTFPTIWWVPRCFKDLQMSQVKHRSYV